MTIKTEAPRIHPRVSLFFWNFIAGGQVEFGSVENWIAEIVKMTCNTLEEKQELRDGIPDVLNAGFSDSQLASLWEANGADWRANGPGTINAFQIALAALEA